MTTPPWCWITRNGTNMPTRLALKDDLITETLSNAAYIFSNATPIHSVIDVGGPGGGHCASSKEDRAF